MLVIAGCACSEEPGHAPGAGGAAGAAGAGARDASGGVGGSDGSTTGGSGGATGGSSAATGGSGGFGACANPNPSVEGYVPTGWVPYTDFSCLQPFFIPSSAAYLPEPVQWEPCDPAAGLPVACESMKVTWPRSYGAISLNTRVEQQPDGRVLMQFMRLSRGDQVNSTALVADVNGPVLNAILQPRLPTDGTLLLVQDFREGQFAILVAGGNGIKENAFLAHRKAVLTGTAGDPRPTMEHLEVTPLAYTWRINRTWLARSEIGRVAGFPRARPSDPLVTMLTGDTYSLQISSPILVGEASLTEAGSLHDQLLSVFTESTGPVALVNPMPGGAYNPGSDGRDLVWTFGEDPVDGSPGAYAKRSIMTAPFTTDPSKLQPRRLRSDPTTAYDRNFAVGCGYAAHDAADQAIVVRLADGVSWMLGAGTNWIWTEVVGMTCDHVYLTYASGNGGDAMFNLARVRLDALGPSLPPD